MLQHIVILQTAHGHTSVQLSSGSPNWLRDLDNRSIAHAHLESHACVSVCASVLWSLPCLSGRKLLTVAMSAQQEEEGRE